MKLIKILKDILAPKKCYSCWKEWHFLCLNCLKNCKNFEETCFYCKNPSSNFETHADCKGIYWLDQVIILTHYKNPVVKKLITDTKFYKKKDILEDFAMYLSKLLIKYQKNVNKDQQIILPVPMYFFRKWKRWYNQSEILSNNISKITKILSFNDVLIRNRNTIQQSKIWINQRKNNLTWAFSIKKQYINKLKWKDIILIDDVISTWSTLEEIVKLLKKYGVWKITAVVIASD